MEFDENGRIILPESIREDKEKEDNSIILEKLQVNSKNPAIAQLRIQIGKNLKYDEEFLLREIYYYCKNFMDWSHRWASVESSIRLNEGSSVIIEARGSFQMYSFLGAVIEEMRELYVNNKGIKISIKGSYSN